MVPRNCYVLIWVVLHRVELLELLNGLLLDLLEKIKCVFVTAWLSQCSYLCANFRNGNIEWTLPCTLIHFNHVTWTGS